MKKFLLLTVMCVLGLFGTLRAQDVVTIGEGANASNQNRIPVNTNQANYVSQQLYAATDINHAAGEITNLAFNVVVGGTTRTWAVYMANTDNETFASTSDWVAGGEKVFEGDVELPGTGGWVELAFSNNFNYTGSGIALMVHDITTGTISGPKFANDDCGKTVALTTFSVSDINALAAGTARTVRNQIQLTFGVAGSEEPEQPTEPEVLFSYDFNDGSMAGWRVFYGDDFAGTPTSVEKGSNWNIAEGIGEGNTRALASNSFPGEVIFCSNYVVTENAYTVTETSTLSWFVTHTYPGYENNDPYKVVVSESGADDSFVAIWDGLYELGVNNKELAIPAEYAGKSLYIGFYHYGSNGDNLVLDNITLTNAGGGNDNPDVPAPTAPETPQNVVATANGFNSVIVTWDAVEGATHYIVYKDGAEWEYATETSFTINGLTAETEYCFAVKAYNDNLGSELSEADCVTTDVFEGCYVTFTFNDSYYGYGVYGASMTVSYGEITEQLTLNTITFQEFTLPLPSNVHVTATYNAGQYSGWGYDAYVSFDVKYANGMEVYKVAAGGVTNGLTFEFDVDCTPKVTEAPVAKAESTGESTILLKWDAVAGAETYNVYRGTETVATGIAETYYTVTGLNPETEYCFTVTTVNEAGESEASEAVCATTYTAGVKIVQIGNGETKESYAPISNYGNAAYSISQQLYLKDEINSEPCAINALSFQNATGAQGTRNIIVYMTNTNKETYASTQDWATVSDSDIVYQGEHTFGANEEWTTIELQTPFIYRGKNVCVTVNDITGVAAGYQGADSFYGTVVDVARGLYKTSSQEQIDCSDLNSTSSYFLRDYNYSTYNYYFYVANVKMRTEAAEVEEIPVPNAPASLVAETINFSSISLTWEAAEYAESYNLYSGTDTIAIGLTETSYTVSRLNPETEYCFTVTAVNLEGESEASVEDCATTDVFEGCFVDFEMNDSYGDGWNGNYLLVSYGDVSERLDLGNGATVTHTLPLPKDVDITVTFVIPEGINTYPGENSFVVRYENGDEIVNTGLLSNAGYEFTFVANCDGTDTPDEPVVPTEIVTVEVNSISGQNAQMHSNYYLPAHTYEAYSISQQIYTNEDLGYDAGYVHSVSFKVGAYGEAVTRSYEVYMKNIEESEFVQTDDAYNYFAVSAEDKVFDGEVTTSGNDEWYTVDFTTSFNYTGANVLLCVYDKTGTSTENPFGYYSVNVMRRGLSSAGSEAYDATALTTGTIRHYVNQVQFEIGPEALTPVEPTLAAPTNLVATRGLYSVMLTWDAVEGAEYYVIYKDGQEWGSSNGTTYTEGNLVAETEYCFEVVAVDADNVYGEKSETLCTTTYELAENEILIGEKSTSYYSPFLANLKNYGGGWFEAIYKAEEIGQAGTISEIAFSYEQGLEDIADINIYLAETSRTAFESNDWTAESELELVYSGTGVVLSDNPFETFVLDTPFEYTGENNLLVVVTTLAENGKSIKWDCYYDANSVLLAIGYPTPTMQYGTDNNKPVMKLTLGEGGNDTPVEPEPVAPEAPYVYASGISESEIELGWYYWYGAPEGLVGYNVYQVEGETYTLLADSVATESYIVEGLAAETEYAFAVTALANGLESEYSEVAYAETYATEPDAVVPVADYYRVASKMNLSYGYLSGTTYKYFSDSTDVVTEIVDEQLGQTSKLIYNENGQLTGYINVYEDWETGEPVEDTAGVTYAYNEQGLLASCTETYYDYWTYQYVTTTDSYTYNEQGQLVELVSESMGTVSEFAYNEDGTLATRTDYYVYEDETTGESSKELNLKYVYVYETGKLVKVNYYYDDVTEGEVEDYEEFEYDEKGNCVKATAYEYGAPYLIVEYEYNTEVAAEKVTPCFEFPQYVLQFSNFVYADYAHQPSSVNILTKERVTRCYPDYETGELVSYPDGVTIYNYEGWVKPSDGPVNPEPTVPAAPEVYAFADNGAVILVWNPVPTATKYAVYQGEDKLGELTDTIVGVNVMGPGEYCFTVTAFNEIGESEHSNLACATVEIPEDTEKPAAPVLTATIENNKIVLSWNAVEGATYYSVYNEGQLLGYIQETTVSLDLPQEYGTYCFTVTASNIAGESEHSNVACVVYGDGIAENEATLNVYPNPVENMLFIETESYIEEVSIYTITGTMIYSEVDFNSNSIDVSDFNGGVYIMKVRTENGEIVKRFIKK